MCSKRRQLKNQCFSRERVICKNVWRNKIEIYGLHFFALFQRVDFVAEHAFQKIKANLKSRHNSILKRQRVFAPSKLPHHRAKRSLFDCNR